MSYLLTPCKKVRCYVF